VTRAIRSPFIYVSAVSKYQTEFQRLSLVKECLITHLDIQHTNPNRSNDLNSR